MPPRKRVVKDRMRAPKRANVIKSRTVINTGPLEDKSAEFNAKLKKLMKESADTPQPKIGGVESLSEILSLPPHRIIAPKQVEHLLEDMKKSDALIQTCSPILKKTIEDVKNSFCFYEDLKHRLKSIKPKEIERFTTGEMFSYYSELLVLQAGISGVLNQLNSEIENVRQKFEICSRNEAYKK